MVLSTSIVTTTHSITGQLVIEVLKVVLTILQDGPEATLNMKCPSSDYQWACLIYSYNDIVNATTFYVKHPRMIIAFPPYISFFVSVPINSFQDF